MYYILDSFNDNYIYLYIYIYISIYLYINVYICKHLYVYIHIFPYSNIQLPCGPIPATVPGMGPKTTKTIQKRHQKFSKNHQKLTPGGVPEALGGGLGTILAPKGVPGTPGDEKKSKTDEFAPPPAPSWETKFGLFVDFGGLFSHRFFDCRFGRFPGRISSGFGVFLDTFLNIFL